jgi:hypothetical protein
VFFRKKKKHELLSKKKKKFILNLLKYVLLTCNNVDLFFDTFSFNKPFFYSFYRLYFSCEVKTLKIKEASQKEKKWTIHQNFVISFSFLTIAISSEEKIDENSFLCKQVITKNFFSITYFIRCSRLVCYWISL